MNRLLIAAAGIVVAVVLFLIFRPGGDDDSANSPPPPNPPTAPGETGTRSVAPPPTTPSVAVVEIPIVVRGGKPVGGIKRVTVAKNRVVVLFVRSDVADEVHLHGYNVMRDVAPGSPARLRFRATIPGRFETELEDAGLQIADVTVEP